MGSDVFTLLGGDPEKAVAFLQKMSEAALLRNQALAGLAGGWKKGEWGYFADDSIQLISTEMYVELILPLHEWWYSHASETTPASGRRLIHLCGDVQRHLPTLVKRLGIISFDTGFPVEHGRLRREIGPDIEVSGGPHVGLLRNGTPSECAALATAILTSGIKQGGRFILQEGNNLPPCCPLENLSAVYEACLEHGCF